MFSVALFFLKRMPKFLALLFNFVAAFLTIFLMLGCYNTSQTSTYLTRFSFNKHSPLFPIIENSFKDAGNAEGLEKIRVQAGYLGVCLKNLPASVSRDPVVCYGRKNLTKSALYDTLNIKAFNIPSNSNATAVKAANLNILDLAHAEVVRVIHPYIMAICTILVLLMFLVLFYVTLPFVPLKRAFNIALLVLSPITVIFFSFGAMWTHVATNASSAFIPHASMGIISVHKGKKAQSMCWFSFAFVLLECIFIWISKYRAAKDTENEVPEHKYPSGEYGKYNSDRSTVSTKF